MASTPPIQDEQQTPSPRPEQTGPQRRGGIFGAILNMPSWGRVAQGSFDTYRKMRANPTLALSRLVERAPIKAADWSFEETDDAPEGAIDLVKDALEERISLIVRESILSMDYGFTAFEKVWEARPVNGRLSITYRKLKPLLVDITEVRVDKDDGGFRGIKQKNVELDAEYAFWFTYDGEPGNEWYGRSKMENCRKVWSAWNDAFLKMGKYASRAAGPVPLIQYPEGVSDDKSGSEKSNYEIATEVLSHLSAGKGVIMPNELAAWARDLAERGVDIDKIRSWIIDFIEPKQRHGDDFTKMLGMMDRWLVRGRLLPERAVLEGEHGTKAEAEVHGDVVLTGGEEFLSDLTECINWYLVDPLLSVNYGPDAVGTVKAAHSPLIDEQKAMIRAMVMALVTSPTGLPLLQQLVDLDASVDQLGLPRPPEDEMGGDVPDLPETDPDMLTNIMMDLFSTAKGRMERVRVA